MNCTNIYLATLVRKKFILFFPIIWFEGDRLSFIVSQISVRFYTQFPKICAYFFMYFCMHFFICMFCACVFHVIGMQCGGFTHKKHACLSPHFCVIDMEDFFLVQNKINMESYWRKKVTSYISTCTSRAAGRNKG